MKGMKRYISAAVMCVCALLCHAQDTISLMNGQKIAAKVMLISGGDVQYKKYTNPDGPTYVEKGTNIGYIRYQNGEVENWSAVVPEPVEAATAVVEPEPVEDL